MIVFTVLDILGMTPSYHTTYIYRVLNWMDEMAPLPPTTHTTHDLAGCWLGTGDSEKGRVDREG